MNKSVREALLINKGFLLFLTILTTLTSNTYIPRLTLAELNTCPLYINLQGGYVYFCSKISKGSKEPLFIKQLQLLFGIKISKEISKDSKNQ